MKKELTIFDKPKNVKRFLFIFYGCLLALLIIDPFIHKHGEFAWGGCSGVLCSLWLCIMCSVDIYR